LAIQIIVEGTVPGIETAVRKALRALSKDLYTASTDLAADPEATYCIAARTDGRVLFADDGVALLDP
jgi:hypothetical protein